MSNPFEMPLNWHTPYMPEEVRTRQTKLASDLNSCFFTRSLLNATHPNSTLLRDSDDNARRFPVVFQLCSVGRSGKDSFSELVFEHMKGTTRTISTVDQVYDVVDYANHRLYGSISDAAKSKGLIENTGLKDSREYSNEKSEAYRQFLHDIKEAWTKFNNGPCLHILSNIASAIRININNLNGERIDIVFVNNRDANTHARIKQWCEELGIICLTIRVQSNLSSKDYSNDCDRNVDDIPYDILVKNIGSLEELKFWAYIFATEFKQSSIRNGLIIPEGVETL